MTICGHALKQKQQCDCLRCMLVKRVYPEAANSGMFAPSRHNRQAHWMDEGPGQKWVPNLELGGEKY